MKKTAKKELVITGKMMVNALALVGLLSLGCLVFFHFGQNLGEFARVIFG